MKLRKVMYIFTALAMTCIAMAGCGNSAEKQVGKTEKAEESTGEDIEAEENVEEEQITLNLMNHSLEEATINWEDEVIAQFEADHPDINVEIQRMSYDDYMQTLQTKFASDDAPDLYQLETANIPKYVENGYAADLSGASFLERYNLDDLAMLSLDGKVYGVSLSTGTMCVTYNKNVFEELGITEVPKTMAEFYDLCDTIKAAGITPLANGYQETWCVMADLQADYIASILTKDPESINNLVNRSVKFTDSEDWRGVFERIGKRYQYMQDDAFGTDWNTACTMFANGEAAMISNGSWTTNNIKVMNPDVECGVFALPSSDNADDAKLAIQPMTEGWTVNAGSPNIEAAMEFLDYYTSLEVAKSYAETTDSMVVVKNVEVEGTGALAELMNIINTGGSASLGPVGHNFPNEFRVAIETETSQFLLDGGTDVDGVLKRLDAEFDRIAEG